MASSLYDATGSTHTKSAMVMDLGKLFLPNPNQSVRLKGKDASVSAPISFAPVTEASVAVSDHATAVPLVPDSAVSDHAPAVSLVSNSIPVKTVSTATTAPHIASLQSVNSATVNSGLTWAKVISSIPNIPQSLSHVEPVFAEDKTTICIPSELLAIGRKKYSLCLIGQFLGTAPKLGFIHAILNKLWGREGTISISPYKNDLFLFQFPNEAAYLRALYRGPWHVGGIPLVLWPWSSTMKPVDLTSAIRPVWVQLKHVPLELLTQEGLSYLASAIGTPLHTDQDCSKLFHSDCANVYIQVDFSQPLHHKLTLDIHGEQVIVEVAYAWKPQFCDHCQGWGHHELTCKRKKSVQWIPKAKPVVKSSANTTTSILPASVSAVSVDVVSFPKETLGSVLEQPALIVTKPDIPAPRNLANHKPMSRLHGSAQHKAWAKHSSPPINPILASHQLATGESTHHSSVEVQGEGGSRWRLVAQRWRQR
ncbi:hypothetical protein Tsubulata_001810 [Turnera subulata]|uniref:DUF4283 domain-containing protein n=1 Tax=Turnera subulata TaxID=218843 RepID=A0A9Q0G3C6_9ROSI|nr:hypothetical protein Tsubulata_001810 [Turnera subulata]